VLITEPRLSVNGDETRVMQSHITHYTLPLTTVVIRGFCLTSMCNMCCRVLMEIYVCARNTERVDDRTALWL
jgi:hypothetical protein